MMHGLEKSDPSIVAVKLANKSRQPVAESVERREGAEGNTEGQHTRRTQSRASVSQGLDRVRETAQQRKERFTALLHYVTVDRLIDAFSSLKREAAPGVDGATWQSYKQDLEVNLTRLHEQVHRGTYRGAPFQATIYSKTRRAAASIGHRRARRQDRSTRRRASAQCHPRKGLSGLFVWVPTWTRTARCAGRTGGWDHHDEGELDRGRRHSGVLRRGQP